MSLHLVRLELDTAKLFGLGKTRHLPPHEVDVGYLLHCFFSDVFGDDAPRPFVFGDLVDGRTDGRRGGGSGRTLPVLAYSPRNAEELRTAARTYADPVAYQVAHWDRLAAKPMPESWPEGQRLGFASRVCPIVRRSEDGNEMDAFLARSLAVDDKNVPLDREEIYRQWLHDEIDRRGGVRLGPVKIVRWQRARLFRQSQQDEGDRKTQTVERPDVIVRGGLEVEDGAAFQAMLQRGLGRHRAFGFGMVLLRPGGR